MVHVCLWWHLIARSGRVVAEMDALCGGVTSVVLLLLHVSVCVSARRGRKDGRRHMVRRVRMEAVVVHFVRVSSVVLRRRDGGVRHGCTVATWSEAQGRIDAGLVGRNNRMGVGRCWLEIITCGCD